MNSTKAAASGFQRSWKKERSIESEIWPEIAERNRRLFAKQRRAIEFNESGREWLPTKLEKRAIHEIQD
ncbi:hypothetical protein LEP1GSC005_0510 [Leptospira santarosai str. ST188]|nr:hypothetical protein LEP1GSC005_0510 [Leptospira santarosai str. ST188]